MWNDSAFFILSFSTSRLKFDLLSSQALLALADFGKCSTNHSLDDERADIPCHRDGYQVYYSVSSHFLGFCQRVNHGSG